MNSCMLLNNYAIEYLFLCWSAINVSKHDTWLSSWNSSDDIETGKWKDREVRDFILDIFIDLVYCNSYADIDSKMRTC